MAMSKAQSNTFNAGFSVTFLDNKSYRYETGTQARIDQSDLWRLAAMLIAKHGDEAEAYAEIRADEARECGHRVAHRCWKALARAVQILKRDARLDRRN
jgi:hypothetical protein